ncbi:MULTISPECIES: TIGR02453 family protein [unclassified Rathayibacter]|uniref:TIGR02453 family protein n=1 Tax=unclassified Rathayibacter TaxID=2609250 RepID=UPI0006F73812|nr:MULTISPECIES: DUF2461 domain-containing protein [unclassified Rathayibacter]KQP95966.1 hypothetical protein ASF42_19250 [Rathayibacter sp. Leaf294]KQS07687.1 hypothetical protein ASG06_17900 [Rathayibacter sp. Leaf185]
MAFTGFGSDASAFLAALTTNNSRQFFDEHRQEYVDALRQPLEDLLGEAEAEYGPGRVMRPNRDVRFSRDRSPYKTSASMWAGSVGGVYLSVTATHLDVGGGLYEPSRDQLTRARTAIDSVPTAASCLAEIVDALTSAGFEMAGPSLKTAPRGYDRDHPRIELLRLTHYAALTHLPVTAPPAAIHDAWGAVEGLIGWVDTYVQAARPQP